MIPSFSTKYLENVLHFISEHRDIITWLPFHLILCVTYVVSVYVNVGGATIFNYNRRRVRRSNECVFYTVFTVLSVGLELNAKKDLKYVFIQYYVWAK